MTTGDIFQELYLNEQGSSLPAGVRIGPVVFAPALTAVDPATGALVAGDLEAQLRQVMRNMDTVLTAAGAARSDIARITLFMTQTSDRTAMNAVYREWFPDDMDRPPHKYLPLDLPGEVQVAAQVIAVLGSARRVIEIPGIHHQDWMSLSGLQGNVVASSRVFGTDPATGKGSRDADEHTDIVFRNVDTILEMAGGDWSNVTQLTAFLLGDGLQAIVEERFRQRVGDAAAHLHVRETDLGGQVRDGVMLPRLEVVALL